MYIYFGGKYSCSLYHLLLVSTKYASFSYCRRGNGEAKETRFRLGYLSW